MFNINKKNDENKSDMQFKTKNGAKIIINYADFEEVCELEEVMLEVLRNHNIDISDVDKLSDVKIPVVNLFKIIKDVLIDVRTHKNFKRVVFNCLKICTYNGITIKEQLFNDIPQARADYYEIVEHCIKENLLPLYKSLFSKLSTLNILNENSQEQKSEQIDI